VLRALAFDSAWIAFPVECILVSYETPPLIIYHSLCEIANKMRKARFCYNRSKLQSNFRALKEWENKIVEKCDKFIFPFFRFLFFY